MSAPLALHLALNAVFDGQHIVPHEDHLDHGPLAPAVLLEVVEQLVSIPDAQVLASKGAIADLISIMQGIEDRAEDEWRAKQGRRT